MSKLIDLAGRKFGFLTVIEKSPKKSKSGSVWNCLCDCGNIIDVTAVNLKSGNTKSCGCQKGKLRNETIGEKTFAGIRFGNLLVIEKLEKRQGSNALWKCLCDCGKTTVVNQENLISGHTRSCGCQSSRMKIGERSSKHKKSNTRLYYVWRSMKTRCNNPKTDSFKYYGERGISVCEEWLNFENFYNWSIQNGYDFDAPTGECTIDRIDVNGNYEPSNCRWVSMKIQNQNKRKK